MPSYARHLISRSLSPYFRFKQNLYNEELGQLSEKNEQLATNNSSDNLKYKLCIMVIIGNYTLRIFHI